MMDHLVLGVPDLAQGIDLVEQKTGVRANFGGPHPGRGTHNALLSLGGRQYLEIIARDPQQPQATPLMFAGLEGLKEPRFVSWAVAVDTIETVSRRALAADCKVVGPTEGSRARTDGKLLKWKTLTVTDPAIDLLPFVIAWDRETPHPSQDSPTGCTLLSFEIQHSDPERLRDLLAKFGVDASVGPGPISKLSARLQTPNGELSLG